MTNIIKIGILKETKIQPDKRVPFSPEQCLAIEELYPQVKVFVQPSEIRAFKDDEYHDLGVKMKEDLSDCNILFGIKEVKLDNLIPNKQFFFFSHTIKKQEHNKILLQEIVKNKIQLTDYECLTDELYNRIIGFGHYAGIVGAYNGILGYGLKYKLFELKRACNVKDKKELFEEFKKVKLPNAKIIITGGGRVANGAIEIMGALGIRRVTPYEFTHFSYREPVYTQLHSYHYNERKDGSGFKIDDFYQNPSDFQSTFAKFTPYCDILMHCSYWDPKAPVLFTKDEMRQNHFRISVIADITCDINGSIPSTSRASTIEKPFYGYNPLTETEDDAFSTETITVMAVDNLPCELPRDASEDFGKELIAKVLPALLNNEDPALIERASITTSEGKIASRFSYLEDWLKS
jgi:alanine dehydrogenase